MASVTMMPQQLVSKSTFAVMVGRSPGAVTHWINDGKLHAPALVQDDERGEVVDVDAALKMLALTLSPSQQVGQASPIGVPTANAAEDGDDADAPQAIGTAAAPREVDEDQKRFVKARANKMEREDEELRRKQLEADGKWVIADEARQAFGRELTSAITEFETFLDGCSQILAAELNVERKTVAAVIRREFRAFRERQAASKRPGAAADLPQAAE